MGYGHLAVTRLRAGMSYGHLAVTRLRAGLGYAEEFRGSAGSAGRQLPLLNSLFIQPDFFG